VDLVEDEQLVGVVGEVERRLGEARAIGFGLEVEVGRRAPSQFHA
jgi:hypothetical protein